LIHHPPEPDSSPADLVVVGGGAAGIFGAIAAAEASPGAKVLLLEKSAVLLAKVRVSGGGRCNVTHHCFDPKELVRHYPRGGQELLGPFHRFQPCDTINWFEERGVKLKVEPDGRMFPTTDNSETIIQCLLSEAKRLGVEIRLRQRIETIERSREGFTIAIQGAAPLRTRKLLLATGSAEAGYRFAQHLGHSLQPPVPSLFTFNVPTSPWKEQSGVALESVEIGIRGSSLSYRGPLLLTHFGFSGPAILKLSAWGARLLHEKSYVAEIAINWLPQLSQEAILEKLLECKSLYPVASLASENPFYFPRNFWREMLMLTDEKLLGKLGHLAHKELRHLAEKLHSDLYCIEGKTTHKEEFVTCGGVALREVDFKRMESKICPGLFFAGELLDIDGITGGFNFQSAWTTSQIAGSSSLAG